MVVTALTLVAFGLPLGIAIRKLNQDQITIRLENEASRAALSVPVADDLARANVVQPNSHPNHELALYDAQGTKMAGRGPSAGDTTVIEALKGQTARAKIGGELVVATPVVSRTGVRGAVRAAVPTNQFDSRLLRAWLLMLTMPITNLLHAADAARIEARRLSKPVEQFAIAVNRLGIGDFSVRTSRTGVPELDDAATALDATAERLSDLVERERSFSANASHQLRTPLTGIRLQLENALESPSPDDRDQIAEALGAVDRLETTISDLIELSHVHTPSTDRVEIGPLIDAQLPSWQLMASGVGRTLGCAIEPDLPVVVASDAAIRQILEVLVSNAIVHGDGPISIEATSRIGGVAIDVADDGQGLTHDTWQRVVSGARTSEDKASGHGMGLPLAYALAESVGGRLLLREPGPRPRFTLLLLAPDDL
jgi:signal transduction histidine kinase